MKVKREHETLVIYWGGDCEELNLFNRHIRDSNVMVLPTRKRTAYVYGFTVFSELTTARHLKDIQEALNALKLQKFNVYVSNQAKTVFKRINDIKRLEMERFKY